MRRLMGEHPEIAMRLVIALGRRLRETNERLSRQSFQTVQSRVAVVLSELVDAGGRRRARTAHDVLVTATQADLAQLAGSSRESASRFLAVLERAGVISQGRGRLVSTTRRRSSSMSSKAAARRRARERAQAREFSAGGVVVRDDEVVVIVPTRRAADGSRVLALPKGHVDPGETPVQAAEREVREETGIVAEPVRELGRGALLVPARRAHDRQGGPFFLFQLRRAATPPTTTTRSKRCAGSGSSEAEQALSHAAEREIVGAGAGLPATKTGSLRPVQVLNFYSTIFADELKRGRKTATIRLGDKSGKYRKNQLVLVTIGYQYSPRERIFEAVIDQVEVMQPRRALAARHQARQPGVSPPRGADQLPRADLRPLGLAGGHRHGRALLADPRQRRRR